MHDYDGVNESAGAGDAAYLAQALQRVEEALAFQDRRLDQLHEEVLSLSTRVVALTRKVEALDRRAAGADGPAASAKAGAASGAGEGDAGLDLGPGMDAGADLGTPPIG